MQTSIIQIGSNQSGLSLKICPYIFKDSE